MFSTLLFIDIGKIIDLIITYGATPVMMFWIFDLRKEVKSIKNESSDKTKAHTTDLRAHSDSYAGLLQMVFQKLDQIKNELINAQRKNH